MSRLSAPPDPPEIPSPFPPDRPAPQRQQPIGIPTFAPPDDAPAEQLFDRRRVLVNGRLDTETTTRLAAQLMTLDGLAADPVDVFISGDGGPLDDVFAVLDVIDLMRAPVNTICIGSVRGTAAAILVSGTGERRAARHATISLRCDLDETFHGSTDDARRRAEEVEHMVARLVDMLTAASGQPAKVIGHEVDAGAPRDAASALDLGLIDTIAATGNRD